MINKFYRYLAWMTKCAVCHIAGQTLLFVAVKDVAFIMKNTLSWLVFYTRTAFSLLNFSPTSVFPEVAARAIQDGISNLGLLQFGFLFLSTLWIKQRKWNNKYSGEDKNFLLINFTCYIDCIMYEVVMIKWASLRQIWRASVGRRLWTTCVWTLQPFYSTCPHWYRNFFFDRIFTTTCKVIQFLLNLYVLSLLRCFIENTILLFFCFFLTVSGTVIQIIYEELKSLCIY